MSSHNSRSGALPELLAPAGSPEALRAAVDAGADAVYFGAVGFNARAGARNFTDSELARAVEFCHGRGVRVYLTLNTLVYDREMKDYLAAAGRAYRAGVDALIVADIGGAAALRRTFPDLPLHASTQMSGHSVGAARELAERGFSRMVLARELSLADISAYTASAPIESEVFIHGALCVCHSGQCLFSSLVGGRSGNRGECAQPCRLPYNGSKYLPHQIDSILKQHYTNWTLYVQDDLSTDNTPEILADYAKRDARIKVVDNQEKLGAKRNFMTLMEKVEADYYMFSDQDDEWLPEKILVTMKKMMEEENEAPEKPVIVHTDLLVVDSDLKEIAPSLWEMFRISPRILCNLDMLGGHCLVTGCTMMFNKAVRDLSIPMPEAAIMHDVWMALVTFKNGGRIGYVEEPTILYRQHGSNTLGAIDFRTNYVINKIRSLGHTLADGWRYYRMLRCVDYGSIFKFYRHKWIYYKAYNKELSEKNKYSK